MSLELELKKKMEEVGTVVEEFKKSVNKEIDEVKKYGQATQATSETVAKLNDAITKLQDEQKALQASIERSAKANKTGEANERSEYNKKFDTFMRSRGNGEGILSNAEAKAAYEAKGMSVQVDEDGGFLVTPEMSSEIVQKVFETSPIRALASVQTISSDALEILEDLDKADAGWVGETQSRPETETPKLNKILIPVHELYAQPKATQKLLDDAAVNVEAWLAGKVSEIFSRKENTAFVKGDGASKPRGILNYASGTGFNQIQRVLTTANNAIAPENLIDIQGALKEPYQANATWAINRGVITYIRKLKDVANGQFMWQPGLQVGVPDQLLGRPVSMFADLPSSVVASTDTLIYGDFRQGYQIVDRIGIRVLRDPYTSKPHVLFYTTKRVGGGVKNFEALKVLRINT